MGIWFVPLTLVLGWLCAILNWATPWGATDPTFSENALAWMFFLPAGIMFITSGFMHTFLAKSTAKNIGWVSNGFQKEIGFVSWGLGVAGLVASGMGADAWIVLSIVISFFLLLAAAQHAVEIVKEKNYTPGNTVILIYDIGLPISLWALLLANGSIGS
jgi:hypothetical protein